MWKHIKKSIKITTPSYKYEVLEIKRNTQGTFFAVRRASLKGDFTIKGWKFFDTKRDTMSHYTSISDKINRAF